MSTMGPQGVGQEAGPGLTLGPCWYARPSIPVLFQLCPWMWEAGGRSFLAVFFILMILKPGRDQKLVNYLETP